MGGNPEQRDGLLEDEAPLHTPVHLADVAFNRDGLEEGRERAAMLRDVHVGDLVHGHEDGCERGVHHRADAEGTEQLHPRHRTGHGGGDAAEGHVAFHKGGDAETEDAHRQGNPHAEKSPNDEFRGEAEAFVIVFAGFHAAAEHLAEGGQDAEFQEGHPERETLVGRAVSVIHAVEQKERQQAQHDDCNDDKI